MNARIVVIGANAAGAKAAARAKRVNPHAEVLLVDRGEFISYGACGIPYFVGDTVGELRELMSTPVGVVRNADFFRQVKGVEVATGTEAVAIDRRHKSVTLFYRASGESRTVSYHRLVLATGASPTIPPLDNLGCPNILSVKTLEDATLLKEKAVAGRAACIVGGGLIGLEMAEALKQRGMEVTLVEMRDQILPGVIDRELARFVQNRITANGVTVKTGCRVVGFDGNKRVERVITTAGEAAADLVVLAPGVAPNVTLAEEAGLELGPTGAIAVNERLQTSDPDIFACGDCAETRHLLTGRPVYLPLGSTANKQGRVAGTNAAGGSSTFDGVLGTTIVRVFDCNVGRTGLTETEAREAGFDVETVLAPAPDRAHFFPGARPIALKLVADRATGRILGLQAVGSGGVDKRIDVAATAITFGATADHLAQLDLAYAPPFASAMDNLIVAADILRNKLAGSARGISPEEVRAKLTAGADIVLLDVRSPAEHAEVRIGGSTLLPLGALRKRLDELPRDREIITFCKVSLRGYEAQKILNAAGFDNVRFMDGGILTWPYELEMGS